MSLKKIKISKTKNPCPPPRGDPATDDLKGYRAGGLPPNPIKLMLVNHGGHWGRKGRGGTAGLGWIVLGWRKAYIQWLKKIAGCLSV